MKNDDEVLDISTSRREFVRRCLSTGAVLAASTPSHAQITNALNARRPLVTASPDLAEYERILSQTNWMDVLGRPRSWSVVKQGFHPFSPERIVVTPTGTDCLSRYRDGYYGNRCGRWLRRRIDERIEEMIEDSNRGEPGYDFHDWLPDSKRESIFRIMDAMTDHYEVRSRFEAWAVGLVGRELLGSTASRGCGLAHQFQYGGEDKIPVDCPPMDWWLFLFPDGIDWAAWDEKKIYAVIAHVGEGGDYARLSCGMLPTYALTQSVWWTVDDWSQVARMGPIEAAWHLNLITANLLDGLFR
jgi:hypothetical protein